MSEKPRRVVAGEHELVALGALVGSPRSWREDAITEDDRIAAMSAYNKAVAEGRTVSEMIEDVLESVLGGERE